MSSPAMQYAAVAMLTSALAVAVVAAYDARFMRPALAIGTVDLADIYRAKEAQFARLLSTAGSEQDRQQALEMARTFSQRLPIALDELPLECDCVVLVRAAVVGGTRTRDLTPLLRQKVELP